MLRSSKCFFSSCLSIIIPNACFLKIYNYFKILDQCSEFYFSSLSILKMLAYETKVLCVFVCVYVCACVRACVACMFSCTDPSQLHFLK